jgi:PAS domain S-box-containing protein
MRSNPPFIPGLTASGGIELHSLFKQAPVTIVVYRGENFIVEVANELALQMWGKTETQVLGRPFFDISPELKETMQPILNNILLTGKSFMAKEFPAQYVRHERLYNGYFDFAYQPLFNSTGEPVGIIAVGTEVTEQVLARKKIAESESLFRNMANEAPLFVWVTDEKLQTVYLNKNGLSYFNLDESYRLSELSWKKFIHPDDIDRVLATMNNAAKKQQSYTLEMRVRNGLTGDYRWFLDKGAPRYANGKFTGFIGTSLDIHDRKEAEKELENKVKERTKELNEQNDLLKKNINLIRQIFDSSVDPIVVYDTDTRIISINQASLNIFGGTEEGVIGKKLLDVVPQLKNTKGHKDLLRAISGEKIHNEIYHSAVTGRYFENSIVPLKDDNDKIYAVLAVAHDNSELISTAERLKAKNEELESTKSFLEQLIDSSVEFISVFDKDLRVITVNRKYEQAMGVSRKDVVGKHLFETNPQLKDTVEHESILKALNGETAYLGKRAAIAKPEYFVDTYFIPMLAHDKVEGVIIMSRDVTDIVESEQALQNKNRELTEAQHLALLGSWEWDATRKLLSWSDALYRIHEISPAEAISFEKFMSLLHPADRDNVQQAIESAYETGRFEEFFYRVVTPSGKTKTLHARGELISDEQGNVTKLIGTGQDVTSQLQLVEQLKKLSESDRLKSDFIKMASHELKTPITSIKGYLQLLLTVMRENDKSPLPPLLLKSSMVSIEKQVDKLTRLLGELLDLSRIESGQLTLNLEEFNLNELVIDVIQDVLYTQPRQVINLYHDHYATVHADKDRIAQVIINLLNNAIKYSPNADKIDVTIRQPKKNYVEVSVKDYGIGIDQKNQEKIFERFYRAEGESEQTYPGFGIGLFIATEIIQRHQGSISLSSEKGQGSMFTFTLPLTTQRNE